MEKVLLQEIVKGPVQGFSRMITNQKTENLHKNLTSGSNLLIQIRQYLTSVLIGDGKKPYCPYTHFIEKKNSYFIKTYTNEFKKNLLSIVSSELEIMFKFLSPKETKFNQEIDPITVVAGFEDINANNQESFLILKDFRDEMRQHFLDQGLMIAYMHPTHSLGGVGKKGSTVHAENPLYQSGTALLMVRRMHKEDHVFMQTEIEKEAYKKYFGEQIPKKCPFSFLHK